MWRFFISCVYLLGIDGQNTMKVLESTVKAGEFGIISGARLSKSSVVGDSTILVGFTICARFKLKIKGSFVDGNDDRGIIFQFGDNFETEFITFAARTKFEFFNVGRPYRATRKSFDSYFLQDAAGNFEKIIPVAWHHLCYSYNITGYSQIVMVSSYDDNFESVTKSEDFTGWRKIENERP